MRPVSVLTAVLLAGLTAVATADDGDAILGLWQTEPSSGGRAHVEITREGDTYRGRIVWVEIPVYPPDDEQGMGGLPRVDRNNPDPARRRDPVIGLEIVEGFRYAGDGQWKEGTIYDPDNGKTYRCKARLEGDTLKVRGFIGISLLGRNTVWTRVTAASAPAGSP